MKDLIISAPVSGIAPSPHLGFGDIRNLDISSYPGVVRLNKLLEKKSSTTVTGLPLWIARNPKSTDNLFALDDAGKVYNSTDAGASWSALASQPSSAGSGQGMGIWGNYLFVARATALDVYGPLDSSPAWTNAWAGLSLSSSDWHPMYVSYNDSKLYIGSGRYLATVEELTTFDPSSGATYTATAQALDLPANYKIKCLTELGDDILIGTWMGTNVYDLKIADIFPWDRSSPSFKLPIRLNENGVHSMINVNQIVYVQAGLSGKVFTTNGYQASLYAQVPESISQISGGSFANAYPQSIMHHMGKIYFGLSSANGGNGVWSISQSSKGSVLNLENVISTGDYTASSRNLLIGALLSITREVYLTGWRDASTYGIDSISSSYYNTTSYGGYFESPMYVVGTPLIKRPFTQGEFQLTKQLTTGQGVRLSYRVSTSDSYTTIGTYDYSTLGGVISHNFTVNIVSCETVQFKCELTTGSSSTSTPELRQILFR